MTNRKLTISFYTLYPILGILILAGLSLVFAMKTSMASFILAYFSLVCLLVYHQTNLGRHHAERLARLDVKYLTIQLVLALILANVFSKVFARNVMFLYVLIPIVWAFTSYLLKSWKQLSYYGRITSGFLLIQNGERIWFSHGILNPMNFWSRHCTKARATYGAYAA